MRNTIAIFFLLIGLHAFAQERAATDKNNVPQTNPRSNTSSTMIDHKNSTPLPYDVTDTYMGRKNEFLNALIIPELPPDFPVYSKQWSVREYNDVVETYYMSHLDILKERVKQKVEEHIKTQQGK